MKRLDPAVLVVLAGVSAALHVGKLPPALPVLRDALGLTLVESGFLLSLVQLAGMTLGLAVGLLADSLGLRRTIVAGLAVLSAASLIGGWATSAAALLGLRALEGFGFLLASLPAPALIRRLVEPSRLARMLGLWGAYMPIGTAAALLVGPIVIAATGWPGWWWLLALLSALMAVWLWRAVPVGCDEPHPDAADDGRGRVRQTLTSAGPWLVAGAFAMYSAQWLAVIGFLPSIYAQAGLGSAWVAIGTALAAGVNMVGNIVSGRFLQRGAEPARLLHWGFAAMAVGAFVAFAPLWGALPARGSAAIQYAGVIAFSVFGGMVPGTLFSVAVKVAPSERTVSSTVGWMQQASATGQFLGPPVVAWVAGATGGWGWTWIVTGLCAAAGIVFAQRLSHLIRGGGANVE